MGESSSLLVKIISSRNLDFSDWLANWKDCWWPEDSSHEYLHTSKLLKLQFFPLSSIQSLKILWLYSVIKDTLKLTLAFLSYFWSLEWVNCCKGMKYHRDTFRLWRTRSSNFCQLHIFIIKPGWKVLYYTILVLYQK